MDNTQRKALSHPYGSSVIGALPIAGPKFTEPHACTICATRDACPIHGPARKVEEPAPVAAVAPSSSAARYGEIFSSLIDDVVERVVTRTCGQRAAMEARLEAELRAQLANASKQVDDRLVELQQALREHGIVSMFATGAEDQPCLMVQWTQRTFVPVAPYGMTTFSLHIPGGRAPTAFTLGGVVDYFVVRGSY